MYAYAFALFLFPDMLRSMLSIRFDASFDPEKHNAWLRRHLLAQEKQEQSREEELRALEERRRRRRYIKFVPFTWRRCFIESFIMGIDIEIVSAFICAKETFYY